VCPSCMMTLPAGVRSGPSQVCYSAEVDNHESPGEVAATSQQAKRRQVRQRARELEGACRWHWAGRGQAAPQWGGLRRGASSEGLGLPGVRLAMARADGPRPPPARGKSPGEGPARDVRPQSASVAHAAAGGCAGRAAIAHRRSAL
jgi:hypothetical protein